MQPDTTGGGAAVVAVLACLLVAGSALAVVPGGVDAQQQQLDGDVAFDGTDGVLTVSVDRRAAANGSFTGDPENVTIDVGGATVDRRTDPGNTSTYTYTVGPGALSGGDALGGQDGSETTVTVSHTEVGSFNETVDARYVVLDGDGAFTENGALRVGIVQSFGVAADGSVAVRVETEDDEQAVPASYRWDASTNESSLVVGRDALGSLGVLGQPQEIAIFGQEQYVQGSATVGVAAAGAERTGGERLADGSGVRFESPLFVGGRTYDVTVGAGGAQYLRTVEAGERAIVIDSRAVAAESSVDLTVDHMGNAVVDGRTVEFPTATVNGSASGATVTFDSLPGRVDRANVSAVWVDAGNGVEQYEAGLNATSRTLTLSDTESLPRPADANRTALLVEFEGATPLHATVALQSDGGESASGTNRSGTAGLPVDGQSAILIAVGAVVLFIVGLLLVYLILDTYASGTTKFAAGPFGSSKSNSPGPSPGPKTVDVTVELYDEVADRPYPGADRVSAVSDGPDADTERIDLTGAAGTAELECGSWAFEAVENGDRIGSRRHQFTPKLNSDKIALSVQPYTVDVRVTGGPDRNPLERATVEATADIGGWRNRKRTDPNGNVQFEVPRSASTVFITATGGDLPSVESKHRIEQATREGVSLSIADGSGSMAVKTTVGDRPWPEVDVRITPISEGAKAYTEAGTVTTKSGGRQTVEGLPAGEYEVTAHPQPQSVDTTAAVERITVDDGDTVEVELPIGISYTMSPAQRERLGEISDRIEELASASNRDVAIPQYYGTVLTSVLDVVEDVESAPERTVETGVSPEATVEALLDATEVGIKAVDAAMSERRNVKLFGACESMPAASVDWTGAAALDAFIDRVNEGGDHERRALRDRLRAVDDVLDRQWGEVNEIAPARKLHDRIGELARETGDVDDELAVVAQTYVGICLLDAVEEIFDHDALVDRLNSGSY